MTGKERRGDFAPMVAVMKRIGASGGKPTANECAMAVIYAEALGKARPVKRSTKRESKG